MMGEHADRFLERCFTPDERSHGHGTRRYTEHIAARFAGKEAAMKALGTGQNDGVSWTDFSILAEPTGRPALVVAGRAAAIAAELGIDQWWVSLSHTEAVAVASVIAVSTK